MADHAAPPPASDVVDPLLDSLRQATIGDYEVLAQIGRGGMAVVYLAHDLALDRKVAIKVMLPALVASEGAAERFKREARTAASLTHPNIIPIYTVRQHDQLLFFVMQFVAGRSLDSVIEEKGTLPVRMVQDILTQVGDALAYAHRHGVIHRDVKPSNILLDEDGRALVTDFGIAKVSTAKSLTQTGGVVGTPSYMSPEQCTALQVTGASDQYCLGLIGYEMLTGRQPFTGATAVQLMFSRCTEDPPPIAEFRPDCPHHLAEAISRMLAREPEDRWPHLSDAITAVGSPPTEERDPIRREMAELARTGMSRQILSAMRTPTSPIPATRTRPPARAAAAPRPARRWWYAAPVAVVLALAGWLLTRPGPAPRAPNPADPATRLPAIVPEVAGLQLSPARPFRLTAGDTAQLDAVALDSAGVPVADAPLSWTSSDPAVARISADGVVRGVGPGVATITVRSGEGMAATSVTVAAGRPPASAPAARQAAVPVADLELRAAAETLGVGGGMRLEATVRDAGGTVLSDQAVAWTSSAPGVVSVGDDGTVRAERPGAATITARVAGVSRSVRLIVRSAPAAVRDTPAVSPPAATPESTPAAPAPRVPTVEEQRQGIAAALAAFRQAVAAKDLARLRRAYPGMTPPEEQAYRELFRSGGQFELTMTSNVPDIQGATARVTGTASYHYQSPRELEQTFNYQAVLHDTAGSWRLASIVFTQP